MPTQSVVGTGSGLPEWATPAEIAAWLQIPLATIYDWRHRGIGPPVHKVGRHLRYRRSELEAWLAERTDAP